MRFNLLEVLTLVTPVLACSNHARNAHTPANGAESVAHLRNRNPFSSHLEKRQAVVPPGPALGYVPRTKIGNVPYGTEIRSCTQKGVIALTFDDGPTEWTSALLDLLARYNVKATFFINGNNNGFQQIYQCSTGYPALIKRMYREGHQIASHTWSHQDLSTLDLATFNQEMYYNERAINNILGLFPTYMRPPFLSCDATCQTRLANLGYHTIQTDLDTLDWDNDSEAAIINAKNNFDNALNGKIASQSSFLPLTHDNHYWTVYSLAEHMLQRMQRDGYAGVTVGTCLGDPKGNWYRGGTGTTPCPSVPVSSPPATTSPPATSQPPAQTSTSQGTPQPTTPPPTGGLPVSPNGQCGSEVGYTCNGLSAEYGCCSQYGWCGATTDHCGAGCRAGFGRCS